MRRSGFDVESYLPPALSFGIEGEVSVTPHRQRDVHQDRHGHGKPEPEIFSCDPFLAEITTDPAPVLKHDGRSANQHP